MATCILLKLAARRRAKHVVELNCSVVARCVRDTSLHSPQCVTCCCNHPLLPTPTLLYFCGTLYPICTCGQLVTLLYHKLVYFVIVACLEAWHVHHHYHNHNQEGWGTTSVGPRRKPDPFPRVPFSFSPRASRGPKAIQLFWRSHFLPW
jgi:hypothetical protein